MKELTEALESMGIDCGSHELNQYQKYMERILEWNEKVNLTSITDYKEFVKKHYMDSVAICSFEQMKNANHIIDVGTGAGFPGIPLAILFPDKHFLLMDSLNKRIKIIDEISKEIGLKNVSFLHGRAEEIALDKRYREKFDLCVSRAVANLAVLSEYCLPFVMKGGWFAAYKTGSIDEELKESIRAIRVLGGMPEENKPIKMRGYDLDHRILFIKKVNNTMAKYPRKAGTPAKEPLK
jgi:16S rRNA (guanine(527)-N(7))-methyltransferase GidB